MESSVEPESECSRLSWSRSSNRLRTEGRNRTFPIASVREKSAVRGRRCFFVLQLLVDRRIAADFVIRLLGPLLQRKIARIDFRHPAFAQHNLAKDVVVDCDQSAEELKPLTAPQFRQWQRDRLQRDFVPQLPERGRAPG